jgi:hypothetical protein
VLFVSHHFVLVSLDLSSFCLFFAFSWLRFSVRVSRDWFRIYRCRFGFHCRRSRSATWSRSARASRISTVASGSRVSFFLCCRAKACCRPVFIFPRSRVRLCAHLAFEQIFRPRASSCRAVVSLCASADFRSWPRYPFCIYSPADFCRQFGLSGHCSWIFSALRLSPADFPSPLPLGPRRSCFFPLRHLDRTQIRSAVPGLQFPFGLRSCFCRPHLRFPRCILCSPPELVGFWFLPSTHQ